MPGGQPDSTSAVRPLTAKAKCGNYSLVRSAALHLFIKPSSTSLMLSPRLLGLPARISIDLVHTLPAFLIVTERSLTTPSPLLDIILRHCVKLLTF